MGNWLTKATYTAGFRYAIFTIYTFFPNITHSRTHFPKFEKERTGQLPILPLLKQFLASMTIFSRWRIKVTNR